MDVDYSPTGREFVAGSYDRSVRIFGFNAGHSREVGGGTQQEWGGGACTAVLFCLLSMLSSACWSFVGALMLMSVLTFLAGRHAHTHV
jgi:hypothetical protein